MFMFMFTLRTAHPALRTMLFLKTCYALAAFLIVRETAAYDHEASVQKWAGLSKFIQSGENKCVAKSGWLGKSTKTCGTGALSTSEEISISAMFSGPLEIQMCTTHTGSGRCWSMDMEDCCETNTSSRGRRSCVPRYDCPAMGFMLHYDPDEGQLSMEARSGDGAYRLFKNVYPSFPRRQDLHFVVKTRGTVMDLKIMSKEAKWVGEHLKKGAILAAAGTGKCPSDSAACGSSCFGVCPNEPVTKNSYCMCYPKGYTGVSGEFHAGAHCLKTCGTGQSVEQAAHGVNAHAAFAEGEQEQDSGLDAIMAHMFKDSDDEGFDDDTLKILQAGAKLRKLKAELHAALSAFGGGPSPVVDARGAKDDGTCDLNVGNKIRFAADDEDCSFTGAPGTKLYFSKGDVYTVKLVHDRFFKTTKWSHAWAPCNAAVIIGRDNDAKYEGTCDSLKVGNTIRFMKANEDCSFAGAPGTKLYFSKGDEYVIAEVEGSFFKTEMWSHAWAPCSAATVIEHGATNDGTCDGLKAGYKIRFLKPNEECSFAGAPGTKLYFSRGDEYEIAEVAGNFFKTTKYSTLWAPCDAATVIGREEL